MIQQPSFIQLQLLLLLILLMAFIFKVFLQYTLGLIVSKVSAVCSLPKRKKEKIAFSFPPSQVCPSTFLTNPQKAKKNLLTSNIS